MSGIDPECFPIDADAEPVCAGCFDDDDLKAFIKAVDGPPGCLYCGETDAPTAPLDEVADRIRECLRRYYGYAVEQLPYESSEGGYQGTTWDTWDLLYDEVGLDLPRDRDDKLRYTLPDRVSEEVWCEYDWLRLDYNHALRSAWTDWKSRITTTLIATPRSSSSTRFPGSRTITVRSEPYRLG